MSKEGANATNPLAGGGGRAFEGFVFLGGGGANWGGGVFVTR